MNNIIYIIHFGMGQKAMKAYECPLPGKQGNRSGVVI